MDVMKIKACKKYKDNSHRVILCNRGDKLSAFGLTKEENSYLKKCMDEGKRIIGFNRYDHWIWVQLIKKRVPSFITLEHCRNDGNALLPEINALKTKDLYIIDASDEEKAALAFAEGLMLGNYRFDKYRNDISDKPMLRNIHLQSDKTTNAQLKELQSLAEAVYFSRDLVNEPLSYLTAKKLSYCIGKMGRETGITVETLHKSRIQALKMGGLLAVNRGSQEPPTFNIIQWKPAKALNQNPIVLVGKGIVFDTGGLSLKTTKNSMDCMKSDMAGAAAVAGTMYAIAKTKLPLYIIGLIPATENRPAANAYTPGDIIRMHNGSTVEVLNTDAEGRLILADALSYAIKYKPELVIDIATLTGAAVSAIGTKGIAMMGTADPNTKKRLIASGNEVFERIAELPFWDDYADLIKSEIADLKNIGGLYAGAITAGKFLEHFTKKKGKNIYPWIHLDIAGPAFLDKRDGYRTTGGTAVGTRLLFDFLKRTSIDKTEKD